jgi:hypothetical protein
MCAGFPILTQPSSKLWLPVPCRSRVCKTVNAFQRVRFWASAIQTYVTVQGGRSSYHLEVLALFSIASDQRYEGHHLSVAVQSLPVRKSEQPHHFSRAEVPALSLISVCWVCHFCQQVSLAEGQQKDRAPTESRPAKRLHLAYPHLEVTRRSCQEDMGC